MKEASGAHFRQWYPSSFAERSLLILMSCGMTCIFKNCWCLCEGKRERCTAPELFYISFQTEAASACRGRAAQEDGTRVDSHLLDLCSRLTAFGSSEGLCACFEA